MTKRTIEHKDLKIYVTNVDAAQGIVEAIVSVFGVIDLGDDIVHSGAFTKTLSERTPKVKVLDNHQSRSVLNMVGKLLEAREVGRSELPAQMLLDFPDAKGGLYTKTQYFLDTPEGSGVFTRINHDVAEYSFGFDVLDEDYTKIKLADGSTKVVRNIRTVRLWEISPVIWGMNQATTTVAVKGDGIMNSEQKDTAPNYRDAGESKQYCANCLFYDAMNEANGHCNLFNFEASGKSLCDMYKVGNEKNAPLAAIQSKIVTEEGDVICLLGDMIKAATYDTFIYRCNMFYLDGLLTTDEHASLVNTGVKLLAVMDSEIPLDVMTRQYPEPEWDMLFWALQVQQQFKRWQITEGKAGRVLSAANASKIKDAVDALISVLDSAGVFEEANEQSAPDDKTQKSIQPGGASEAGSHVDETVPPSTTLESLKRLRNELLSIQA